MKKSLRSRIMIMIFTFVIILDIVSIYMNYKNFVMSSEQFSYSTANTVSETCSLIIDTDEIQNYITTGKRNTAYYTTWNKLIDYRNTNEDIVNLSVVWFDSDGCHYVFDTDITDNGAFLGDTCRLDSEQKEKSNILFSGGDIDFIKYTNRMDLYRPLVSSSNTSLGYVVVGISTLDAERDQFNYLIKMIIVSFTLTFLMTMILLLILSKSIIRPINELANAAGNYSDSIDENQESSVLQRISINTGDEIERLFLAMKKMEMDLLNSSNSLSIATWNSNHDSMTKLYNKRYLTDFMFKYAKDKPVAAYYFDVDNLKKMNDICGHEHGDDVICRTAEFIKKHQHENTYSFRMGGDEFLMLVCDISGQAAEDLFNEIQNDPDKQLTPPESKVSCRIAVGYKYSDKCTDLEKIIQEADKKMYLDKHSHRD